MSNLNEKFLKINRDISNFTTKLKFLTFKYEYHVDKTPQAIFDEYKRILTDIGNIGKIAIESHNNMKNLLGDANRMTQKYEREIDQIIRDMGWSNSAKQISDFNDEVSDDDNEIEVSVNDLANEVSGLEELKQSFDNEISDNPDEESTNVFIAKTDMAYTPMVKSCQRKRRLF